MQWIYLVAVLAWDKKEMQNSKAPGSEMKMILFTRPTNKSLVFLNTKTDTFL